MKDGFTAKVCEQFQWLNKEELDQAMDIVMRANFAGDPVTKEETMQLRGLYRYTCRMVLKGMSRSFFSALSKHMLKTDPVKMLNIVCFLNDKKRLY